jgi:uncharacterized cupredoxin-like copper-binding protein
MVGRGRKALAFMSVAALGLLAACSGGGNAVNVTEKDFQVSVDKASMGAGEITFKVHNDGPSTHEFVIFKSDLAPDQLPMTQDENGSPIVDEAGQGVEHVDEIEDITSGSDQELKVNLAAGKYVLICNLPAHYQQGMHAAFTVS